MSIKNITTNELRRMKGREGIIFPGCGGDLNDWLNGINATFNEEGLFLDGTKFTDCYVFKDDRVHCLLFPFDDSVKAALLTRKKLLPTAKNGKNPTVR